jgi:beta-lactam-binding protein with PASTA domain
VLVVSAIVAGALILQTSGSDAAVALDRSALPFSPVAVNQISESQTITARNIGGTPVHVDDFVRSGPNSSEFVVRGTTCRNKEIAAGETCRAEVVFTPTGAGPREASVTVDVREVSTDPAVQLSGSSLGPDQASPSAVPTELSFGEQPLNTAGERRQVSIGGPPGGPVVLGTASVEGLDGDFVIEGDGCSGAQLVPGGACTVGARFAPGAEGPRQALLTLPRLDGLPPVAVPLSGTGATPSRNAAFEVQPRSIAFGNQPVSVPGAPEQVVVTNSGDVPLDVSPVSVLGAPDFAVGEAACPATLEPGEDCAATVVLTPVTTGGRQAQLLFGPGNGPTVPLSGVGTAPDPAAPDISPRAVTFGEQLVGGVSPPRTVTVTNRADRPLRIRPTPVTAAAASFRSDTAACTASDVAPGASCAVSVTFAPNAAGAQSGIMLLTAEGFPDAAVVLTGVGLDIRTPLVPNVIGMTLTRAQNELAGDGFVTGTIQEVSHPDIPRGSVSDQVPRAGFALARGEAVDLFVSTGAPTVRVPNLVGLTRSEAAQRLADSDLRMGSASQRQDPSAEPGTVLESDPPGGSEVAAGDPVDLVLVAERCTVPDVSGRSESAARGRLAEEDLNVGEVTDREESSAESGTVLETDPSAGTAVDCGGTVDLVVAIQTCYVPDVIGLTSDTAAIELRGAGLTVGQLSEREDSSAESGIVLGAAPAPDTKVDCGRPVNLVVAAEPPCLTDEGLPPDPLGPTEQGEDDCNRPPCPPGQERVGDTEDDEGRESEGACTDPPVICTAPQIPDGQGGCTDPPVICTAPQIPDGQGGCTDPPVTCTAPQIPDDEGGCTDPAPMNLRHDLVGSRIAGGPGLKIGARRGSAPKAEARESAPGS